ncbi:MAG TPA: DNA-3-methyladenine glycosylase [Deltaproteobacteria bacterium]|nr:DNA-3-methyladenine glycosylase [Deltaproteobacteria bacterium]
MKGLARQVGSRPPSSAKHTRHRRARPPAQAIPTRHAPRRSRFPAPPCPPRRSRRSLASDGSGPERRGCACASIPDTRAVRLGSPLRQSFFARDVLTVAAELVGCRLVHRLASGERLVLRLVEVEAYLGEGSDPASHAHRGPTPRNRTMFGPAGRLYAYRSYGIHTCVNVVCGARGTAAAVLLRAGEPLEGLARMRRLRGLPDEAAPTLIARGPGRLAQALGLGLEHDGQSLLRSPLTLHPPATRASPARVLRGPRVGIGRAVNRPHRFFEADSRWVSPYRPGGGRTRKS